MEALKISSKIPEIFHKYKYILLVVAIGIGLMLIPEPSKEDVVQNTTQEHAKEDNLETQLVMILSQVKGAGRVSVMLTTAMGEQTIYQSDIDKSDSQLREDTVIISGEQRAEKGLVSQIIPPKYLGAIIVCDGADNATVRLAILEAVAKATGLGTNQISVLKMK